MHLTTLLLLPCLGAAVVTLIPSRSITVIRTAGLWSALITFVYSLGFWICFDKSTPHFQFTEMSLGLDGISLFFVILTTFLIPICLLCNPCVLTHTSPASCQSTNKLKEFILVFLAIEALMLAVFCMLDLLVFYVFFESVLIPMFLIIGIWGSRQRKIQASYQFFLYTLIGSVLMLLGILLVVFQTGSTDLQILYSTEFSERRQIVLWLSFFASFAVKVPMVPVHLWLPEAHVEAPTAGSVILAGILLKLGTYGFLRFSIPLFPCATVYFTPLIMTLSVVAIIYTSLTTLRQIDLKKIIAYSSVAHMNCTTIGLFSNTLIGIEGSLLLMLSHGLVSSALFLCVGALYDRHKTRLLHYYSGLVTTMPLFSIVLLMMTLANMGLPGTSSFVGEVCILAGAFHNNTLLATCAALGMILGAAYSLWLFNRVVFGAWKTHTFADLNRRELCILLPFVVAVVWMAFYPEVFLESMHSSVASVVCVNTPSLKD